MLKAHFSDVIAAINNGGTIPETIYDHIFAALDYGSDRPYYSANDEYAGILGSCLGHDWEDEQDEVLHYGEEFFM